MKTLPRTAILIVLTIMLSSSIFAQSSANANVTVSAQLSRGLSLSHVSGDIDFSEIVLTSGTSSSATIEEEFGAKLQVIGHPNKSVAVSFSSVTLTNNDWVGVNGGTNDDLIFTPSVEETGASSTYSGAGAVSNNDSFTLTNVSGDGALYLWVGGSIAIASDQAHGDYTGTFTMTVEY
ncbi:MAG: DUF4402 domain-containing protein [Melioribacteraceae bacterium]|nr:DUF4402 domain-containing protein [Melioribacteraceae bacterium]